MAFDCSARSTRNFGICLPLTVLNHVKCKNGCTYKEACALITAVRREQVVDAKNQTKDEEEEGGDYIHMASISLHQTHL